MLHKACTKCKRELPATTDYFYKSKKGKFGLRSICKECLGSKFGKNKNIPIKTANSNFKICTKCNKELPRTNEYFSIRHRYGKEDFSSWCKECSNKSSKEWKKENLSKVKIYNKKYGENYYKENKEKLIEYTRQYNLNNKEKIKIYKIKNKEHYTELRKKYYKNNKEYYLNKTREWIKNNPEKIKIIYAKQRHKRKILKNGLPIKFNLNDWEKCKKYFNNKCAYCGKELPLSQDHFIPLSKGGEYTINNIIPACKSCNSQKNAKSFFEWYPKCNSFNKERQQKILKYLGYKNNTQQLSII